MTKKYILNWFGMSNADFNSMVNIEHFDAYCMAYDCGSDDYPSEEEVAQSILAQLAQQIIWAKSTGLVV